jgi:hypothetical protein
MIGLRRWSTRRRRKRGQFERRMNDLGEEHQQLRWIDNLDEDSVDSGRQPYHIVEG